MNTLLETDTVVRAVRTFAQAFVGTLLLLLPTDLVPELSVLAEVGLAAGWAGVIAVLTWLHNELEDAGRVRDRR